VRLRLQAEPCGWPLLHWSRVRNWAASVRYALSDPQELSNELTEENGIALTFREHDQRENDASICSDLGKPARQA
jgi:hypothetical protein